MKLLVKPVDVWLFRDGRPFDAGSEHRAVSRFPPHPSVMQGVLRSHHLVVHGVDLSDRGAIEAAVGTATRYGKLRVRGPFVARQEDGLVVRYFPLPADAATVEEGRVRALSPRRPAEFGVFTGTPLPMLLWAEGNPRKDRVGGWLRERDLESYLKGDVVPTVPSERLFARELRVGIARDNVSRTGREGFLYEAEYVRPRDGVGLDLEVEGLDGWPQAGVMRMGGEGRAGCFCASNSPAWPRAPEPLPECFKLYLATPALFCNGWRPADWRYFLDGEVEFLAAAVGGYEAVGGFDLARGWQKPSRRYVPAGSVYFFKSDGRARLRDSLVNGAVTEEGAEIGYGQIMVGRWQSV